VRPATTGDIAAITACAEAAYAPYVPRIGRAPAPMVADFAAHVAAGEVHVIEAGGQLAGYMVMMVGPGEVFIDNVAIDPKHQGLGLGGRLMALAEATAREQGHGRLRLYTNLAMTENVDFYGYLGFAETERRHEDGFDRIYMVKTLD
jgi:ribosomal protein S18 acetylase RimI-like enzyme